MGRIPIPDLRVMLTECENELGKKKWGEKKEMD